MRKYPIGIQSFKKIVTDGYIYIDKTSNVKKLTDEGTCYFLSRPRRFGKSLFLDTLRWAFWGNKELFKGVYIEDRWDWCDKFKLSWKNISIKDRFAEAIRKLYAEKYVADFAEIYLIGVEFSKTDRNITRYEWETVRR